MIFIAKGTPPEKNNKYYIRSTKGGYNTAIDMDSTGYVLPNCVGYAQGRFREIQSMYDNSGSKNVWSVVGCNLAGDAKTFYEKAQKAGMRVGQIPKLGSIICFGATDGAAGHVAIVEGFYENGDILITESGYNAYIWKCEVLKKTNGYMYMKERPLQGFIYQFIDFDNDINKDKTTTKTTTSKKASSYFTYKVQYGDTLWQIAQKYLGAGNRYKEIMTLNKLKNTTIYTNQTLKIPKE